MGFRQSGRDLCLKRRDRARPRDPNHEGNAVEVQRSPRQLGFVVHRDGERVVDRGPARGAISGEGGGEISDGIPTLRAKSPARVRSGRSSRSAGDQQLNRVIPVPAPYGTRLCNSRRYRWRTSRTRSGPFARPVRSEAGSVDSAGSTRHQRAVTSGRPSASQTPVMFSTYLGKSVGSSLGSLSLR